MKSSIPDPSKKKDPTPVKTLQVNSSLKTPTNVRPTTPTTSTSKVDPIKEKLVTTPSNSGLSMSGITQGGSQVLSRLKKYAENTVSAVLPAGEKQRPGHHRSMSVMSLEESMKTVPTSGVVTNPGKSVMNTAPPKKKLPKIPWLEDIEHEKKIKMNIERISLHGVPYLATCIAFDVLQGMVAIGTEMGIVHVIGETEHAFYYEKDFVIKHVTFATNLGFLIGICEGSSTHICVWDLVQKHLKYAIQIGPPVTAIHMPIGSKFFFFGTKTGSLKAFNVVDGFISTWGLDFRSPILSIETNPSSDQSLVVGLEKGNVVTVDLLTKAEKIYGSLDKICCVTWHPSKEYFAAGYQSGVLLIWRNRADFPHIVGSSLFKGGFVRDLEWNGDDLYVNLTQSGNDKSGIWLCKVNLEQKSISANPVFLGDKITKFMLFQTNPHKYFQKGARYAGIIKEKQFFIFDITLSKITNDSLIRISSFNFEPEYQAIAEVICVENCHTLNPPSMKKTNTWPLFGGKSAYKKDTNLDFLLIRYQDGGVQTLNSSSELSLLKTSINLNRNKEATCMSMYGHEAVVIGHSDNSINIVHCKSLSQFEISPSTAYLCEITQVFAFPDFGRVCIGHSDGVLDIVDVSQGEYKVLHQVKFERMVTTLEGAWISGDKGATKYVLYVGLGNGKISCISLESGKEIIKKGKKDGPKITHLFAHDEQGCKSITKATDILPAFIANQIYFRPKLKFNEKQREHQNRPNLHQIHSKAKTVNPILFLMKFKEGTLQSGPIHVTIKNINDEPLLTMEIESTSIFIRHRTRSKQLEGVKVLFDSKVSSIAKSLMIMNDQQKKKYLVYMGTQTLPSDEYNSDIDMDFLVDSVNVSCEEHPKEFESGLVFLRANIESFNIYYKFQMINPYELTSLIPDITCSWSLNDTNKIAKFMIACTDNMIKCYQLPRIKTYKKRKSKLKLSSFEIKENGLMICLDEKGYVCAFSLPDLQFVFKHALIHPKLFRNLIPKSVTILKDGRIIAAAQENILLGAIVEEGIAVQEPDLFEFGVKFPPKQIGYFSHLFGTGDYVYKQEVSQYLSNKDMSGDFCKITVFKYKKEKKVSKSLDLMRQHVSPISPIAPKIHLSSDVSPSPTGKKLEFSSPITKGPDVFKEPIRDPLIKTVKSSDDISGTTAKVAEMKINETKTVMSENVDKMKERGEKLEEIRMSVDGMRDNSTKLSSNLEKLRKANETNTFW